jgi:hypothetical protein
MNFEFMDGAHVKFEVVIDKLVPYSIGFILIHFIGGFIFPDFFHTYENLIVFLEVFLITFVLGFDVFFKYRRAKDKSYFLRHHWLDIIAVFPFMILFRVFEEVYLITRLAPVEIGIADTQRVLHELRGADEAVRLVREAEVVGRTSRVGMFGKMFRPIARLPRVLKGMAFYEHPLTRKNKGHHSIHYIFYSKHARKALKT